MASGTIYRSMTGLVTGQFAENTSVISFNALTGQRIGPIGIIVGGLNIKSPIYGSNVTLGTFDANFRPRWG